MEQLKAAEYRAKQQTQIVTNQPQQQQPTLLNIQSIGSTAQPTITLQNPANIVGLKTGTAYAIASSTTVTPSATTMSTTSLPATNVMIESQPATTFAVTTQDYAM